MTENLRKGDRVRLGQEALTRGIGRQSPSGRLGVIFSEPMPGRRTYQVLWDGLRAPMSYARSFIERAEGTG